MLRPMEPNRDGTLTIMVGGDEGTLKEVLMPVYRALKHPAVTVGGQDAVVQLLLVQPRLFSQHSRLAQHGSAQQIKLINQLLTWVNHAVLCEAGVLAKKAGLDERGPPSPHTAPPPVLPGQDAVRPQQHLPHHSVVGQAQPAASTTSALRSMT